MGFLPRAVIRHQLLPVLLSITLYNFRLKHRMISVCNLLEFVFVLNLAIEIKMVLFV